MIEEISTLVRWGGEFGRTPTVELQEAGANVYCALAGDGSKGRNDLRLDR